MFPAHKYIYIHGPQLSTIQIWVHRRGHAYFFPTRRPFWEQALAAGGDWLYCLFYFLSGEELVPLWPLLSQDQGQGDMAEASPVCTGATPGLMCFDAEGFVGLFPQSASTSTSKPTQGRTWRGGRYSSSPSTLGPRGRRLSCSRLCKRASTVPTSRSWSSPWSSRVTVVRWCQVKPWSRLYEEGRGCVSKEENS